MIKEMKERKLFINEGVVYNLNPLTSVDKIITEIEKEVRDNLVKDDKDGRYLIELGRAVEFFTENDWKVIVNGNIVSICRKFEGRNCIRKRKIKDIKTKEENIINDSIYIPSGWMCLQINKQFNFQNVQMLPNSSLKGVRELLIDKKPEESHFSFRSLHPHAFENGGLCHGLSYSQFKGIDEVINVIKGLIYGSEKGTSIWDYNPSSPSVNIENCIKGKYAFRLHQESKTDEIIWEGIMNKKY